MTASSERANDICNRSLHIVVWGTYDTGKPRTRNLIAGLRSCNWRVTECHSDVWRDVEDKTRLRGLGQRVFHFARWMLSYPGLVIRYLRLPPHDLVVVGYMGQLDVLVLWPFARLRRAPIVWDALISLYNTTTHERRYFSARHPQAAGIYALEWLGCRAADRLLANTDTATRYFTSTFNIAPDRAQSLFVGVETNAFPPRPAGRIPRGPIRVLFYGSLIPLHGIRHILEAARLTSDSDIDWTIIGDGQEAPLVAGFLDQNPSIRLDWITWVPYQSLATYIHAADVGLGVFADSTQARWTIPNKVFQMIACGIPIITRDSPGARELLNDDMPGIYLVDPESPAAICAAIERYRNERESLFNQTLHERLLKQFTHKALGRRFAHIIAPVVSTDSSKRNCSPQCP